AGRKRSCPAQARTRAQSALISRKKTRRTGAVLEGGAGGPRTGEVSEGRLAPSDLHNRRAELSTHRDERPRRGLRVPAEADVGRERVLVTKEALDRITIVDAVGAGERMESVDRLGAKLHRIGDVALEAQLFLERRR